MVQKLFILCFVLASAGLMQNPSVFPKPSSVKVIKTIESLPTSLDWSNFKNTSFLTIPRNYLIPQFCDGVWAFVASLTISDRFKVLFNAGFPDIVLAPQVLLSCDTSSKGCESGDFLSAYNYIYANGITDETCEVYVGKGYTDGLACDTLFPCYTCQETGPCYDPQTYSLYNITGFEVISGVTAMMNSLVEGPISCGIYADQGFVNYSSGIILNTSPENATLNHAVEIIGYGAANGTEYWKGRNLWGTHWGDGGYFLIQRGTNALGIEQYCASADPNPIITIINKEHKPL